MQASKSVKHITPEISVRDELLKRLGACCNESGVDADRMIGAQALDQTLLEKAENGRLLLGAKFIDTEQ